MKKTGWYSGYQKPLRMGIYERDYSGCEQPEGGYFCLWDGNWWGWGSFDKDDLAASVDPYKSMSQRLPWRGVAKP